MNGQDFVHNDVVFKVLVPVLPKRAKARFHPLDEPMTPMQFDSETHSYRHVLGQWVWQRDD